MNAQEEEKKTESVAQLFPEILN